MFSKRACQVISGGLVGSMLIVAWSEFQHGANLGDIHLITPAPLAPGALANGTGTLVANSTVTFMGTPAHDSAIIEAQYLEPPNTAPLPLNGVVYPRTNNLAGGGSVTIFST